jgi:hypothetical protein
MGLAALIFLAACSADEPSGPPRTPTIDASADLSQDGGVPAPVFSNSDASVPDFDLPDGALALPEDAGVAPNAPDDDVCGSVVLKPRADVVIDPGTVLVVFDNSGSMGGSWNGEIKWTAAAEAIAEAVTPLAENLTVAARAGFAPTSSGSPAPTRPSRCST